MLKLEKNKLNLLVGGVDSGKTTTLINHINFLIKNGKKVLYINPDTKSFFFDMNFHCLHNDVDLCMINPDKETQKPKGLKIPDNLTIIDYIDDITELSETLNSLEKGEHDCVIIDNLNQFKIDFNSDYYPKMKDIFDMLNTYAEKGNTFFVSYFMISINCWEDEDFQIDDEKYGNYYTITKDGDTVTILKDKEEIKAKISPKNLKLEVC